MMMAHYIYAILLCIGLFFAILAIKFYGETKLLLKDGYIAEGIVVAQKEEFGYRSNSYRPLISYTDHLGNNRTFESEVSTRPITLEVGDTIKVVYDPNKVGRQKVVSFWGLYRMTIIFLCISLPMLVISVSYYLYRYGIGIVMDSINLD
jgi:hypothetical protein